MIKTIIVIAVVLLAFHVIGNVFLLKKQNKPIRKTPLNELKETLPRTGKGKEEKNKD